MHAHSVALSVVFFPVLKEMMYHDLISNCVAISCLLAVGRLQTYRTLLLSDTSMADYGFNPFALISSHPSQYWFAVHGLYLDDPDAIDDVSDVYDATLCGKMTLKFIGYFSFLLIMAKLLAMGLTRLCYGGMV